MKHLVRKNKSSFEIAQWRFKKKHELILTLYDDCVMLSGKLKTKIKSITNYGKCINLENVNKNR